MDDINGIEREAFAIIFNEFKSMLLKWLDTKSIFDTAVEEYALRAGLPDDERMAYVFNRLKEIVRSIPDA